MPSLLPLRVFFCTECDSPSVEVAGPLEDTAEVICGDCGERICTWSEFVDGLARAHDAAEQPEGPGRPIVVPLLRI